MSIFSGRTIYAQGWQEVARRGFTSDEIKEVVKAVVVDSQYGSSCCFMMAAGGNVYIPMSTNSVSGVGETLDLTKAQIVTLERNGERIDRIEG